MTITSRYLTKRSRIIGGSLYLQIVAAMPALAADMSCHIHPPIQPDNTSSNTTEQKITYGPYPNTAVCESAKQDMFGALGKCHCSFGFSFPFNDRSTDTNSVEPISDDVVPLP